MPIVQKPFGHGKIVWLGKNTKRGNFSTPCEHVIVESDGIVGDMYRGMWRLSSSHDVDYIATDGIVKGDPMLNLRQITIVSDTEVAHAADDVGIRILPGMLRENIIVSFVGDSGLSFSKLPPLSRMVIGTENPKVILLTEENGPCRIITNPIASHLGHGVEFSEVLRTALTGRRGQMGMVRSARPVTVKRGGTFQIFPPMA
jgi:hypothetical protein